MGKSLLSQVACSQTSSSHCCSQTHTDPSRMTTPLEKAMMSNNLDAVTAAHPHMDDPRFLAITNQMNHCLLRFHVFTRCARELGEENTRCKFQYYRAQCACPESQL